MKGWWPSSIPPNGTEHEVRPRADAMTGRSSVDMTRTWRAARSASRIWPTERHARRQRHINFAAPTEEQGECVRRPKDEHGLSSLARHCLGGLIAHHEALAVMSAPTIISYKRLIPGIIAGYWANWGSTTA